MNFHIMCLSKPLYIISMMLNESDFGVAITVLLLYSNANTHLTVVCNPRVTGLKSNFNQSLLIISQTVFRCSFFLYLTNCFAKALFCFLQSIFVYNELDIRLLGICQILIHSALWPNFCRKINKINPKKVLLYYWKLQKDSDKVRWLSKWP